MEEFNFVEFGKRICYYRKQAKMSQHKLADSLGISYQHMSNIERGQAKPSLELAVSIAAIFDMDLNILVGRESKSYRNAVESEFFELISHVSSSDLRMCFSLCETYLKTKYEE